MNTLGENIHVLMGNVYPSLEVIIKYGMNLNNYTVRITIVIKYKVFEFRSVNCKNHFFSNKNSPFPDTETKQ